MRVLHLITSLNTGGAEMMLFKLLSRMNRDRFDSRVISLIVPGPVGKKIEDLGIRVEHLGLKRGFLPPLAVFKLTRRLNAFKPDLIQTWMYHSDLLGLITAWWSGQGKVIWNIRCSSMELSQYSRVTAWAVSICKRLSGYPHAVITNSHTAKADHLALGYHPREFRVIPNGFDLAEFKYNERAKLGLRRELGLEPKTLCIGMMARYDPKKDHGTFLKAVKLITERHADSRFILCGEMVDSTNTHLTDLIHDLKIDPFVRLLGRRDDMTRIMAAMDILVLSSAFGEGFPNVVGEAMACEVPCVVTRVGDAARIVGDTGRVVAPREPGKLAAAVIDLIDLGPESRHWLGKEARARIVSRYSLDRVVKAYESLYLSTREPKDAR